MLLREALDRPQLKLALLTGAEELERPVTRVYVTDLPDPRRYLSGGEIVLTGLMWRRQPEDSEIFVAACAAAGVSAIGAGDAAYGSVPPDLIKACRRHRIPLFEVPVEVSFREIIDEVTPSLWAQRASGLATVLGRHRGAVAAMAAGARLVDLLAPIAAEVRVDCWVLTPTGRLVAGTGPLPAPAEHLAAAFLSADRLPASVTVGGRPVSLVGVAGRPEHRLGSWLLACTGAEPTTAPTLPDAAAELISLVVLERARADEALRVERRLSDQIGELLAVGGDPGDLRARLLSCGLPPDSTFLAVTAALTGTHTPAELTVTVLEEIVRPQVPQCAVTGLGIGATEGALAIACVAPQQVATFVKRVRAAVAALAPGLGRGRLAVGISTPATGATALAGAVDEARHASRSAQSRAEHAAVVSAGDLAAHELLLAAVPADTRRAFRDRLLGPVLEYDRTHDTRLLHTLETFLACSGSWSRCAALLHVHVNTLRYRIGRIEHLTGRDLTRFEDRVDFFLALRLPR